MEVDKGPAEGGCISADQSPQAASTAGAGAQDAAENHGGNDGNETNDPESDPYGTEIKPESDDEGLMEREERHLRRLEAQEQEQNEQHGNEQGGDVGNADDGTAPAPAGNTLDGHTPDNDDEEAEGYAAILDPLHGYSCPDPDYATANALPFPTLVKRFDTLWSQRKRLGNRQPREQLLEYLLPRTLLDGHLAECSIYPLLRLILPDCDVARGHLGMKEKSIANAWAAAMHLSKDSRGHKKLVKFMDPQYAGHTATGDLSLCVKEVVAERFNCRGSKISVGQMNLLLDELQQINSGKTRGAASSAGGAGSAAHAWRTAGEDGTAESAQAPGQGRQQQQAARAAEKQRQKKTRAQRQAAWVEKLIKLNLSVSDSLDLVWFWRICPSGAYLGCLFAVLSIDYPVSPHIIIRCDSLLSHHTTAP